MLATENPISDYTKLSGTNVLDKFKLLHKEDQKVVIFCEETGKNRKSLIDRMKKINSPKTRGRKPGTKNRPKTTEPTVPLPPSEEPTVPTPPSEENKDKDKENAGGGEVIAPAEPAIPTTEPKIHQPSTGIVQTEPEKDISESENLPPAA